MSVEITVRVPAMRNRELAYIALDGIEVGDTVLVPRPYYMRGIDNQYGDFAGTVTKIGCDWHGPLVMAKKA